MHLSRKKNEKSNSDLLVCCQRIAQNGRENILLLPHLISKSKPVLKVTSQLTGGPLDKVLGALKFSFVTLSSFFETQKKITVMVPSSNAFQSSLHFIVSYSVP
jgi:hypothetical protein